MTQDEFLNAYFRSEQSIDLMAKVAADVHAAVAQTYGDGLPYAFHLRLTAGYVTRFAHLVLPDEAELETLYAAAYFHDAMEDARLTYNDLYRLFEGLCRQGCMIRVPEATELVFALTNEKGRNRSERASDRYYEGIRGTRHAAFLKMCDRLANIRYSTLYGIRQRMAEVYRREMPHFLESIGPVPQEMADKAARLLDEGYARP